MSVNLGTTDNPLIAFLSVGSGYVDAMVRATDRATFDLAALQVELYREQSETGEWIAHDGVDIDHIGPIVITPAVVDDGGVEVAPAVMDNRHHVNVRLSGTALETRDTDGTLKWHKWSVAWTQAGQVDENPNANEEARILHGVALIDPATVSTPGRVWL